MPALQSLTLRRLERRANEAIVKVIDFDPGTDVGRGAFIRIFLLSAQADGMKGLTELWNAWIGGRANKEREPIYQVLSFEKALRTALNYQMHAHVSSYESMRPNVHQYQGASLVEVNVPDLDATRPSNLIVSVSGLSALNDQRTGLLTIDLEWGAYASIMRVLSATDDSLYLQMRGQNVRQYLR